MIDVHALGRLALGAISGSGAVMSGPSGGIALRPGYGSTIARAPVSQASVGNGQSQKG